MAKTNAALPQGTRDFGPDVVRKRQYIFQTIRSVFELYGFQPLETPAMENLDTLMGKYGEEGDKLIFKILNNGLSEKAEKADGFREGFENVLAGRSSKTITERALKYDLTIPFARYVAMNHNNLTFPFKRYQIQPVWRADRPQRGRYREFYQCDADVVGSQSLWNEVELGCIYDTAFRKLGLKVKIKINNRKILAALAETCGGSEQLTAITIAIDKLDKIGLDKVKEELVSRGLDEKQVATIAQYLSIDGEAAGKLDKLASLLADTENSRKGIEELRFVFEKLQPLAAPGAIEIDLTLARGLNYYTGTIFEVKAEGVSMGSIGGGGRYDDLTGLFGVPNIPGVGISFGVDRIYDVLDELGLFPDTVDKGTTVLFFNLGIPEGEAAFDLLQQLRSRGVSGELYHEAAKFDKQFKYAEKKGIAYAVIIGSKELETKTVNLKDLARGEQQQLSFDELLRYHF